MKKGEAVVCPDPPCGVGWNLMPAFNKPGNPKNTLDLEDVVYSYLWFTVLSIQWLNKNSIVHMFQQSYLK
jgi:hypothetical protein